MKEREQKEEFTSKMHGELTINAENEVKHRVWAILSSCKHQNKAVEELIDQFDLTLDDISKYEQSYFDIFK